MILTHNLHMFLGIQKLKTFQKNLKFDNTDIEMWCHILQQMAVFGIGLLQTKKS